MASAAIWIKAQAEHRAGTSLAKICKKFGMSMAALLKRIKEESWTRPGAKKKLPAKTPEATEQINSKIDAALEEAVADIIQSHRSISRQLREELDSEIAEFQELKLFFVSALDKETIEELIRKSEPGQPNTALVDHLNNILISFGRRMGISDKLVRLASLIVETERTVWAIDKQSEGPEHESYDDLLESIKLPLRARSLPAGVADFEKKLEQKRST